jgi:hypothetical protein
LVSKESLKNLLHEKLRTRTDQLLLCLAVDSDKPKTVTLIRQIAADAGLRSAKNWNISDLFAKSHGRAIRVSGGWELTSLGKQGVATLAGIKPSATIRAASSLRKESAKLKDTDIRAFVEESIACLEAELFRAAVVLAWVGAVAVLYQHVLGHYLAGFNAEAKRRDPKWKDAKTSDDLARMKEYDFLQILEAISMLGKSVKNELEVCLRLRNGCGHPSSLKVGESRVSAHIEALISNVFSSFT